VPAGLEGVVVAETTVGDVRGQEGFFHYRQYSAVELAGSARSRTSGTCCSTVPSPTRRVGAFADEVPGCGHAPAGTGSLLLPACRRRQGSPLDVLRTGVSVLGAELGWRPTHDIDPTSCAPRRSACARWCPPC
jgi:citrate synthase